MLCRTGMFRTFSRVRSNLSGPTALITVRSSDKLSAVFATLVENNVLSAAVLDEKTQTYTWVVDVTHVLEAALTFSGDNKGFSAVLQGLTGSPAPTSAFNNMTINDAVGMHTS